MSERHWLEDVVAKGKPSVFRSFMLAGTETEAREREQVRVGLRGLDELLMSHAKKQVVPFHGSADIDGAIRSMLPSPAHAAELAGCTPADVRSWCERVLAGDTWWRS